MACPYFDPGERLGAASGSLGDLYSGHCRADAMQAWQPDEQTVADRCNLGYARGRCSHFPPDEGPDAVRFCVAGLAGGSIRVLYTMERNHRPFSSGALEYSTAAGNFAGTQPEPLGRLAHAYVRSYLRRAR